MTRRHAELPAARHATSVVLIAQRTLLRTATVKPAPKADFVAHLVPMLIAPQGS